MMRRVASAMVVTISVGAPCLVNEFHDPGGDFHQVDIYFRCHILGSAQIAPDWQDREAIVTRHRWVTQAELAQVPHKPDSLGTVAFGPKEVAITYDPLEPILR